MPKQGSKNSSHARGTNGAAAETQSEHVHIDRVGGVTVNVRRMLSTESGKSTLEAIGLIAVKKSS